MTRNRQETQALRKTPLALTLLCILFLIISGCGGGGGSSSDPTTTSDAPSTSGSNPISGTPPPLDSAIPSRNGPFKVQASFGVLVKTDPSAASVLAAASIFRAAGAETVLEDLGDIVPGLTLRAVANNDVQQTLSTLRSSPTIVYAEPNYVLTAFATPNDPRYLTQYHLNNTGQSGGGAGADISAELAWDIQTGSSNVVIAVIDTGVDYTHPDLSNNIWINSAEIPNNGIDDDANGFTDDVRGWDFANNDADPMDDNRHGSHVSGIIAAQGNNGVGVSGVNWTARIMPLKFLAAAGSGTTADAILAISYAINNGANIINASWGGGNANQSLQAAITAANNSGILFVAAAGNNGSDNDVTPSYPASYTIPNVVSVASTTDTDGLSGFSNFGATSVHLGAPGSGILSTVLNQNYATLSGTSMAAPVVAGVAGLVLAANPSLTVVQLKNALVSTVDPKPSLANTTISGGRINAFNAVQSVSSPTPPPVTPAITVNPTDSSIVATATQQFTASGGALPYAWSLSNTQAGSVDPASGLFTAAAVAGVTNVIATDANLVQGQTSITVTTLAITPNTGQVGTGQTLAFTAAGGTAPYTWSTSNPAFATITNTGILTAVSPGTVTVTATDSNAASATSGTITIMNAAAAVSVTPQTQLIGSGDQISFIASGGTPPYNWASSATAVLSIDAAGVALGLTAGTATVTATDATGVSGSSGNIEVRTIQVQAPVTSMLVGGNIQLTANGSVGNYQWSSSDTTIATVDANGNVTGLGPGSVLITATDADNISGNSPPISVQAVSSGVSIAPNTVDVPVEWWVRFTAAGAPPFISWGVSNPLAGRINATTGWFKASDKVGETTTIQVLDSTGSVIAETGIVNIQGVVSDDD